MSRNGSGGYTPPSNSWFPAVNGVTAATADWNATLTDIAAAIQQSISADGQTPITGNLQMGGNKLTGLAAGSGTGQSLRYEQLFSQGTLTDIASSATVDIGGQLTNFLRVTGTTGITSFGTNYNGPRFLIFAGAVLLTHSATLVLPSAANITTAANDALIAVPISGGWQVVAYQKADGSALASTLLIPATTSGSGTAYTITPSPAIAAYAANQTYWVTFHAVSGATPTLQISGVATPPNLVKQDVTGAYVNIQAGDIPLNHRSRVTLISTTQALVEELPPTVNQIQPVTGTVAGNALTVGLNATVLEFRSATLTTGVPNKRPVPTAISLVVPNTATLGTVSGVASRIAVIAIDNAGTIELAVVNYAGTNVLDESGLISTTAISGAATSANVFYSTTARTSVPYRVVGFVDSTQATAGTWASTPTLVQGIGGLTLVRQNVLSSMVRVDTVSGYGSTNTKIARFTNTITNQGSDITYADSATLGGSFTINVAGVYAVTAFYSGAAGFNAGISLNTTVPTTNIYSIPKAEMIAAAQSPVNEYATTMSQTMYLAAGSVLRFHTAGVAFGSVIPAQMTVQRVA